MADARRTGATNAAAVWCSRNLVNLEPQFRTKFQNALAARIHRKACKIENSDEACVIQVINGKPDSTICEVLQQLKLDESVLAYANILILVYPDVVWVDKDFNNFRSEKMLNECIYKETRTF